MVFSRLLNDGCVLLVDGKRAARGAHMLTRGHYWALFSSTTTPLLLPNGRYSLGGQLWKRAACCDINVPSDDEGKKLLIHGE